MTRRGVSRWMATLMAAAMLAGCQPQARSTRLTGDDLQLTTTLMADSLAASRFMTDRTADSPPVVIMINRVRNLTSDIITLPEQWMMVAKVRDSQPIQELARQRNVRFVITPEQHRTLREAGYAGDLESSSLRATHVMSATFRSADRAGRIGDAEVTNVRADYYYLDYAVSDIDTGEIQWSDKFEFKREVVNKVLID